MKKLSFYQVITLLITILTIGVNALANALPLNNLTTGEISDQFAILFVPAGYVFSIWGLIYTGMIAFTIYQLLPAQRDNQLIRKITPAYWLLSLANTAWIFLWHYEVFLATLLPMLTILAGLIFIYLQITNAKQPSKSDIWLIKLPFSIYLGWVSVAVIANISQVLFFLNWNGFGLSDTVWAITMLVIATGLGAIYLLKEKNYAYVLVLVWAFAGIGVKQIADPGVSTIAYAASVVLLISSAIQFVRNRNLQGAIQ